MRTRLKQAGRRFFLERLEERSLLSGGFQSSSTLLPGALNSGFGNGGVERSSVLGSTNDIASSITYQRLNDGKIVAAGTARGVNSQSSFALTRYNIDGSPDTAFGNKGTVYTPFLAGTVAATASAVAIEPDNKIVVAGTVQAFINGTNEQEFALVRYNANGSLDTSFGNGGEILTAFGPNSFSTATSLAIAPNGSIIVAGGTSIGGNNEFALARYNTNGTFDQNFGFSGEAAISFGPGTSASATSVVLQTNGKIVVAGGTTGSTSGFALARLNNDGSLDTSFGGGLVTTTFDGLSTGSVAGIALTPGTGAIVVAGTVQDPSNGFTQEFALARFNSVDGTLDTTFGNNGRIVTPSAAGTTAVVSGVAIQPNTGAIVAVGTTSGFDGNSSFFQDLTLNRYKANGSVDTSFGSFGQVLTGFGTTSRTSGAGVVIQPDGKIVAQGSVSFVSGGTVSGFLTARYNVNGSVDHGFATRGTVITNVPGPSSDAASGEVIQPDGKILVFGTASVFSPNGFDFQEFALTRFNRDGTLDTHFGNNGSVLTDFGTGSNQAVAVTLQTNGKIVVVGTIQGTIFDSFEDIGLARYNSNGTLDTSFGTGGEVLTDFGDGISAVASGLTIQPDGKIVVIGTATGFDSDDNFFQDVAVARYNTNGRPDNSFGNSGQVLTNFGTSTAVAASGVAIQADNKILVAGTATDQNTFVNEFELTRYSPNGKIDITFGTGGKVFTSFGDNQSASAVGVAIQANNKIVLAGSTVDPNTFNNVFALTRYNTNGSLDSTFGSAGRVTASFGANRSAGASSLAIQPDGRIVVAGTVLDFAGGFNQDFGVARFNGNGSLDNAFGNRGEILTSFGPGISSNAAGVAIASDGDIIVVGTTFDNSNNYFTLVDYVGTAKKANHR